MCVGNISLLGNLVLPLDVLPELALVVRLPDVVSCKKKRQIKRGKYQVQNKNIRDVK